jgi:hypothetical protein
MKIEEIVLTAPACTQKTKWIDKLTFLITHRGQDTPLGEIDLTDFDAVEVWTQLRQVPAIGQSSIVWLCDTIEAAGLSVGVQRSAIRGVPIVDLKRRGVRSRSLYA